jgi:hypothetical protein
VGARSQVTADFIADSFEDLICRYRVIVHVLSSQFLSSGNIQN